MNYVTYTTATDFLAKTRGFLEADECVTGLMLGLSLSLEKDLFRFGSQPFFASVESGGRVVLAALMTPPHKLQLIAGSGVDTNALRRVGEGLVENRWNVPAVLAEKELAHAFGGVWRALTGACVREGMRQRVHKLTKVNSVPLPEGRFRRAREKDVDLAIAWAHGFHRDCFGDTEVDNSEFTARERIHTGGLFFWETDRPVSMAARTRPTCNGESISFVYTPPEKRGRGYATAVVANAARTILDEGREFCSLFTDLANPTSNSIYRKIGFEARADMVDVVFTGRSP